MRERLGLLVGIALMFLLTWPLELWIAAYSRGWLHVDAPAHSKVLLGFGFIIAVLSLTYANGGVDAVVDLLRRFVKWWVGWRWYAFAFFGFPFIAIAAVLFGNIFGPPVNTDQVIAHRLFGADANLWLLVGVFFIFDGVTNGEEIGWRGYVLPRLQAQQSALTASLWVGLLWTAWHLPKFLEVDNHDSLTLFFIDTMAKAVIMTWLYNSTRGSLLLVAIAHASINVAAVFMPLTAASGGSTVSQCAAIASDWALALFLVQTRGTKHLSYLRRQMAPEDSTDPAPARQRVRVERRA